jgi:hypothetical protein
MATSRRVSAICGNAIVGSTLSIAFYVLFALYVSSSDTPEEQYIGARCGATNMSVVKSPWLNDSAEFSLLLDGVTFETYDGVRTTVPNITYGSWPYVQGVIWWLQDKGYSTNTTLPCWYHGSAPNTSLAVFSLPEHVHTGPVHARYIIRPMIALAAISASWTLFNLIFQLYAARVMYREDQPYCSI